MTIENNRFFTLILLIMVFAFSAKAEQKTTIVLKNGSKITGRIIVQRPGRDVTIAADNATFIIEEARILSQKQKKVKYENLGREWKRWALEHNALTGNANGRYLTMTTVTTKDNTYTDVVKTVRDVAPKTCYVQVMQEQYKVKWNDVDKIEKTAPKASDVSGLDDEIVTLSGKKYRGTIVSQLPGNRLTIKTTTSLMEIKAGNIRSTRKVARNSALGLYEQAGYVNTVILKKGQAKEGIIVFQNYGKKAKDQYLNLLLKNGKTEKILTADVMEYRTTYPTEVPNTYYSGNVYVNEFHISKAKTVKDNGSVAFVDKKVYPFPEGIVITFKSPGTKLSGSWKLVALDKVDLSNGKSTYGYTDATRVSNAFNPSAMDVADGVLCLSFTYLSPGYYALVNDTDTEAYIIKITK